MGHKINNNNNNIKKILSSRAYHAGAKPLPNGIIKAWQLWLI